MSATKTTPKAVQQRARLSDAQFQELMSLIKGANSVELKLTVPDTELRTEVAALGMDPLTAQIRQVYFFDTPDLALNQSGVVVRARRVQGRAPDTVVKLRPVVPNELPAKLRKLPTFNVEVDAMPGGFVCSASLKGVTEDAAVKAAVKGDAPIRKLFSKEQRAFFAEHAPAGVDFDKLSVLGPILVLKLRFKPADYSRRLVVELWNYPDYSRILELSTKCLPTETFDVAAETRAFLLQYGVDLTSEQHTKTKTALEFFAGQLAEPAA